MTEQETFNFVVNHLYEQGRQAIDEASRLCRYHEASRLCRYRTAEGLKCAAGCLIPDDQYDREMEGTAVTNLPNTFSVLKDHNIQLVRYLQVVHDGYGQYKYAYSWNDYLDKKLPLVAEEFGLQFTRPKGEKND